MSNQNDTVLCNECGQRINATTNWCTPCNAKHFKSNFQNWTSGSVELDEFIRKTQITAERHECIFEWVDYSKFSFFEKVEHSKNHRAYWEEGPLLGWNTKSNEWTRNGGQWEYEASKSNPSKRLVYGMTRNPVTNDYAVIERLIDRCPDCESMWVALKSVEKGEEGIKEFLEEIKSMHQCRKINLGSLDCYGVTRHSDTKKYLMVIRFVEFGDLRNYLSNFATNSWKDLLDRIWSLTIDLRSLHRLGLVHRDLHSGNVLFGDNRRNFVADLGLACKDEKSIRDQFLSSDLKRQRSSRPTITFRELSTRPLTSCRLPTVSLTNQDPQYQTTQYDLKITNDLPF
ncbi:1817_t:CDS:2 [Diversispora eburnea]|uniref:1817_t:CDS:1 n=1 Tax=Diversispora eburnea TaxID=1213867 RepID=A0A9N8ZHD5_9GLOM|nr:1817_t:CDS:2 [Diversispora eburnea]